MYDRGTSILTRGMIAKGGVPIASSGYVVLISEVLVPARTTGPARPHDGYKKPKKPAQQKKVTITVILSGETYERTVVVAPNVSLTAANVEVEKLEDLVEIKIKLGKVYLK